ncbi:hypothetical protein [Pseudorhodoferax soli]|uniref:Uncharacterized protein n=1 Tax=Pseudorhodoferax soli TaxID=545864 RepID=A0A368Y2W1_9BURK|nr:hypothetical protein [Pseudorhodoferax soli]RCW74445.1 hypothetical protein DES41_102768 [Pseudorhodoferax soli]
MDKTPSMCMAMRVAKAGGFATKTRPASGGAPSASLAKRVIGLPT